VSYPCWCRRGCARNERKIKSEGTHLTLPYKSFFLSPISSPLPIPSPIFICYTPSPEPSTYVSAPHLCGDRAH